MQSIHCNEFKNVIANVFTFNLEHKRLYDIIKQMPFSKHSTCSLNEGYKLIIDTLDKENK